VQSMAAAPHTMGGCHLEPHALTFQPPQQIRLNIHAPPEHLQAEADEFAASAAAATAGKPLPSQPEGGGRAGAAQQIPMNQSRGAMSEGSRGGSLDALALELHAAEKQEATAGVPQEATDGGAYQAAVGHFHVFFCHSLEVVEAYIKNSGACTKMELAVITSQQWGVPPSYAFFYFAPGVFCIQGLLLSILHGHMHFTNIDDSTLFLTLTSLPCLQEGV